MDSILEEEEEEDEEEEDTEFPSEILFRFLLGTLLSFSAGREGRNEVSVPRERGRGVCSPSGMGMPPAAATSPPAERPRSHLVTQLGTWASPPPPGTELPTVLRHPQNG